MLLRRVLLASLPASAFAQSDLLSVLQSEPDLSTLLDFLTLTNLTDTLATARNITIVAPTNAAFAAVPQQTDPEGIAASTRDAVTLGSLLRNHVFQGYYPSDLITDVPTFAKTLVQPEEMNSVQPFTGFSGGQFNGLVKDGQDVNVLSGELSVSKDIMVGDRVVIHVIDNVLQFGPPFLTYLARAGYLGMNAALSKAQLPFDLGLTGVNANEEVNNQDLTIFVPIDAGFESIGSILQGADNATLQQVLGYHIIQGNALFTPQLTNTSVPTFQGTNLQITVTEQGEVFADNVDVGVVGQYG